MKDGWPSGWRRSCRPAGTSAICCAAIRRLLNFWSATRSVSREAARISTIRCSRSSNGTANHPNRRSTRSGPCDCGSCSGSQPAMCSAPWNSPMSGVASAISRGRAWTPPCASRWAQTDRGYRSASWPWAAGAAARWATHPTVMRCSSSVTSASPTTWPGPRKSSPGCGRCCGVPVPNPRWSSTPIFARTDATARWSAGSAAI